MAPPDAPVTTRISPLTPVPLPTEPDAIVTSPVLPVALTPEEKDTAPVLEAPTPPDTAAGSVFDPFYDGQDDRPEDEQGGRPKEMNKPFKDSGARGRDPLGKQTKNRRPLALAHFDALKKTMGKKSKAIINETQKVEEVEQEYNEYKNEKDVD